MRRFRIFCIPLRINHFFHNTMHTPHRYSPRIILPLLLSVILCAGCTSRDRSNLGQALGKSVATLTNNSQSDTGTSTPADSETDADGLEIPAPLTTSSEQILHRTGYTVSYNHTTMLPNWVAWHLTAAHADGQEKRGGVSFQEDEDVPSPRATDTDYRSSGYDRGHMCPAGDNKWSKAAMTESFLFTNICPQAPSLNRGDWNEMELACRRWAKEYGDLYIVCGPILYKGKHKTIGKNHVTVPEAFFKVILCTKGTPKAIGFIYKNGDGNRPKGDYANTIDEVERITGIDFFPSLPDDVEKKVEASMSLSDWGL